jgi:hypothetical protein
VAAEGLTLDGLTPGQPAPTSGWSRSPAHPGSFLRGGTQIDVKDGRIVSVWGKRLQTSEGGVVQRGDSDAAVARCLGKAERTLYGCGKDNQQVRFFDRRGLEVTSTHDKVVQIHLFTPAQEFR